MKVRKLSISNFDEILECFLKSFDDYSIKMPTEKEYYKQRWSAAKVDFNLSYGMYVNNKLIGFVIHTIDKRFGIQTAFNTGTGVIPEYRGKKIVGSIYDYAKVDLKENGVELITLEVLTNNDKAIRAYQGVGFNITKEYKCYSGKIQLKNNLKIELKKHSPSQYNWEKLPEQNIYSWDFQKETIVAGGYVLYEVIYNGVPESYFIFHPEKKYLAQFDVFMTNNNEWEKLFNAIQQVTDEIKIINVNKDLSDKINAIHLIKLHNFADQYEMELPLNTLCN
ncbi:GNAT family N-acetyltransferase [Flammeovirga sp. EKP202]|uniref:GNAT family N-acetyltransferase n=1 Tax=Flammeovirga sp. EKP202 TaxID=2770592 RepID=UPI00165FD7F9|nr:GNAT family N-acetyltransferase [Flammeovirga sp. EKP202]MBD0401892.1 GNAT family N-acetyltransferase [Flammeovirga sp. EKP202]